MGQDAEPLTAWVVAGAVVVPLGVFVYEGAGICTFLQGRRRQRRRNGYDDVSTSNGRSDGSEGALDASERDLLINV